MIVQQRGHGSNHLEVMLHHAGRRERQNGGVWTVSVRARCKFAVPMPDALESELAGPLMCAGSTAFTPMVRFGGDAYAIK